MQQKYLTEMALRVDFSKPGFGLSNDGNTDRKFFENVEKSSNITGIGKDLIIRFRNILIAISCGNVINYEKFRMYRSETAKFYVKLYPWYDIPKYT